MGTPSGRKKYSPEYSPGEILVAFEGNPGAEFAREFGSRLGYSISPDDYSHGNGIFIYKTPEGMEGDALLEFRGQSKFVSWAERRDLKLERRWETAERAIGMLEELKDSADSLPDSAYSMRVREICRALSPKGSK